MRLPYFLSRSIRLKLTASLIAMVSVMFVAFQSYEYVVERQSAISELEAFSTHAAVRISENMIFPLWELDEDWVSNIIETEMQDKNIYALVISTPDGFFEGRKRDDKWRMINAYDVIEGDYISRRREVVRNSEKIGVVDLYVSTKFVEQQFREIYFNNLIAIAVLVITITLLMMLALNKIVLLPLKDILVTVRAIAKGDYSRELVVTKNDEVGMLADNFNAMKENVFRREAERDNALEELEGRTAELIEAQEKLQQDVNERVKAQKEIEQVRRYLKSIIDSMPSMVVGVDADTNVTHWNLEAEHVCGVTVQDASGRPIAEVMPMLSNAMARIKSAIQQRQPELLERIPYSIAGERHYADVMISPLVGQDASGAVIRIDNITERVRMEQIMTQTEKMMSLGGLAAGMAHELNNPLGGMMQGVQNIRRRLSPGLEKNRKVADELGLDMEKIQHYLQQREIERFIHSITEAGERASAIVNNMLRFSRKGEDRFSLENLTELIDRTTELASVDYDLKKKYDFRSIDVQREYQPGLPPVRCVASEIQQVILNLLRNAAQILYEQKDRTEPPRIIIRISRDEDNARIEVEDNGPGMDETTRQRVFEPFFTTRPPGQGTGLGLSVSYYILHDEHGGDIEVETVPGKGTKFILLLPLWGEV